MYVFEISTIIVFFQILCKKENSHFQSSYQKIKMSDLFLLGILIIRIFVRLDVVGFIIKYDDMKLCKNFFLRLNIFIERLLI